MKKDSPKKYISCIRINGTPILPPLITAEKRKEIKRFKREAIKIENRLKRERELKKRISELHNNCTENSSLLLDNVQCNLQNESIINNSLSDMELKSFVDQIFNMNLETITEQNNSNSRETDLISNSNQLSDQISQEVFLKSTGSDTKDPENTEINLDNEVIAETRQDNSPNHPRLIRSNSYVLDTPSPALLEYVKNNAIVSPNKMIYADSVQKNTIDSETSEKTEIISLKNDVSNKMEFSFRNPQKNEENHDLVSFNDENSSCLVEDSHYDTSRTETELKCLSDCDSQNAEDLNLHELVENNVNESEKLPKSRCKIKQKHQTDITLQDVLTKLPQEYSKQILHILEREKITTAAFYDVFDEGIQCEPEKFSTPQENTLLDNAEDFYYSAEDFTIQNGVELMKTKTLKGKMTKEEAAEILCAATKGFLVRRLMKTEKVQILVQTIREALLCAVQLHTETFENISASDVELHRRLIQQVSAACYAFHDVFFNTSIHDQLSYIAVDRQKKREKLRRLSSAKSNSSNSSSNSRKSTTPRSVANLSLKRNRRATTRF